MKRLLLYVLASLMLAACHQRSSPASSENPGDDQDVSANGRSSADKGSALELPLERAAQRGDLAAMKDLLAHDTDVNAADPIGRTALHMACFFGRQQTAELLISAGAKLAAKDMHGFTPLHAAVLSGNKQLVALLLAKGADVHAVTDSGLTPLHLAAATGNFQVAKLLMEKGADVNRQNAGGQTPWALASRNAHTETAALLQRHGGK